MKIHKTIGQEIVLTPIYAQVLMALSDGKCHGYGIIRTIEEDTSGKIVLLTGTLYTVLHRLTEEGLIEECQPDKSGDPRRKFYQLTENGTSALMAEVNRMRDFIALSNKLTQKLRGSNVAI